MSDIFNSMPGVKTPVTANKDTAIFNSMPGVTQTPATTTSSTTPPTQDTTDYSQGLLGAAKSTAYGQSTATDFAPLPPPPTPPAPDFTTGLKKYYEGLYGAGDASIEDHVNGFKALLADPKVDIAHKQAEAQKIIEDLQKRKDALTQQQASNIQQQPVALGAPGYANAGNQFAETSHIGDTNNDIDKQIREIDALQQQLGSTGKGGDLSRMTQQTGNSAKLVLGDPNKELNPKDPTYGKNVNLGALDGLSDQQIKEMDGELGAQITGIGSDIGKFTDNYLAYKITPTYQAWDGLNITTSTEPNGNPQSGGMRPVDRAVSQRTGVIQSLNTLADLYDQQKAGFEPVEQGLTNLESAYKANSTPDNFKAIQNYIDSIYKPHNAALNKIAGLVNRFQNIVNTGFPEIDQELAHQQDIDAHYQSVLTNVKGIYSQPDKFTPYTGADFVWKTSKALFKGSLLDLYAPAFRESTYNFMQKAVYGTESLLANVERFGDTEQYRARQLAANSRLKDRLIAVPERFKSPVLIKENDPKDPKNILQRVDWIEAGPQMLSTTISSGEIIAATALAGGGLAELGLAADITAGTEAATIPVTAHLMYGDLLQNNLDAGYSVDQATALASFQSVSQGIAMRYLNPLNAKVFNPEYYASSAVESSSVRGVMKSLYKGMTGVELSASGEKFLIDANKLVLRDWAASAYSGTARVAKVVGKGAYATAQGAGQMVAIDLLNAPANKIADENIPGFNYTPVTQESLLKTAINAAITMLPMGFYEAGHSILQKQLPSFRYEVAKNPEVYIRQLSEDYVNNRISSITHDKAVEEITRIKDQFAAYKHIFDNLPEKAHKVDLLNAAVQNSQLMDNYAMYALFPELLLSHPTSKEGVAMDYTYQEYYEKHAEGFEKTLREYGKIAAEHMNLSKAERAELQEKQLIEATNKKYTDNFIYSLVTEDQIAFFKKDLEDRDLYINNEKVKKVTDEIRAKLDEQLGLIKEYKEKGKAFAEAEVKDPTPKTEILSIGGKKYHVIYNEPLDPDVVKIHYAKEDGTAGEKVIPGSDDSEAVWQALNEKIKSTIDARKSAILGRPVSPTSGGDKTITLPTFGGGTKDYEVGKTYYVGKKTLFDSAGNKVERFGKITILGKTPSGDVLVRDEKTGKEATVTASAFADYKLGSVDSLAKDPIARYYVENSDREFKYNFGKGFIPTGHLEYDPEKKILEFVYTSKGEEKRVQIDQSALEPGKGKDGKPFDKAKLRPGEVIPDSKLTRVEQPGDTPEETAKNKEALEELSKETSAFSAARQAQLERREAILKELLHGKQEEVDKAETQISKVSKLIETNKKELEEITKKIESLKKIHETPEADRGIFAKMSGKDLEKSINQLVEMGSNLEKEKTELENNFNKYEAKLNKALQELGATKDVLKDIDLGNYEEALGDILEGRLSDYKDALKRAKAFIKEKAPILQSLADTIEAVKGAINDLTEFLGKAWKGRIRDAEGNLYWDEIRDQIKSENWDDAVERLASLQRHAETFDNLKKKLDYAYGRIAELKPKIKALKDIVNEVKGRQSIYDSARSKERRIKVAKKLGMEMRETSDQTEEKPDNTNEENLEIASASQRKKSITIISNSTVTPSSEEKVNEPAVKRRLNAQNRLAEPSIVKGKLVPNSIMDNHRLLVVTKENAAALSAKHGIKDLESILHGDNSIAVVLIAHYAEGIKFLSEKLEHLDVPSADNLVYSYLPEAEVEWKEGAYEGEKRYYSKKDLSKEEWEAARLGHEQFRSSLMAKAKANPETLHTLKLTGVSSGKTNVDNPTSFHAVSGRLVSPEFLKNAFETGQELIIIPTGKIGADSKTAQVDVGSGPVNMPLGQPLLRVGTDLRFANTRMLTEAEKTTIKDVLKLLAYRAQRSGELKSGEAKSDAPNIDGVLDPVLVKYLKGVLYWRLPNAEDIANSKRPDGDPLKKELSTNRNQLYIDFDWSLGDNPSGYIVLGKNRVQVPFDAASIDGSKDLDDFLDLAFHNVDAGLLSPKNKDKEFFQITHVDSKGNPQGKKWGSYQEYLLSDEGRKPGETPLGTNVAPISEDPTKSNIEGRYMLFENESSPKPIDPITTNTEEGGVSYQGNFYKQTHENLPAKGFISEVDKATEGRLYISTFTQTGTKVSFTVDYSDGEPKFIVHSVIKGGVEQPSDMWSKAADALTATIAAEREVQASLNHPITKETGAALKEPEKSFLETSVFEKTDEKTETPEKKAADADTTVPPVKKLQRRGGRTQNTRIAAQRSFYETEDFKAFKKWLGENFPDSISAERVPFLIDGNAEGQFKDNVIRLYKRAQKGTGYHESFEAVWNAFLSPIEREAHLSEFGRREGSFIEHNTIGSAKENRINYKDATTSEAKEQIAEEFKDFMLHGTKFEGVVKQEGIFRRMLNWIRNVIFGKPGSIDEVFGRISSAYYKNRSEKWSSSLSLWKNDVNYRKFNPDNIHNIQFFNETMDGMSAYLFSRLSQQPGSIPSFIAHPENHHNLYYNLKFDLQNHFIGKGEFYEKFWEAHNSGDYGKLLEHINDYPLEDISPIMIDQLDAYIDQSEIGGEKTAMSLFKNGVDDFVSQWKRIDDNYGEFVEDHKEHLEQYGLRYEQGQIDEEQKVSNEDYSPDILSLSVKDNSSTAIKLLIASLVEKESLPDGSVSDKLSPITQMPKLVDYGRTWALLLNELAGTRTVQEQVDKIRSLVPEHPELQKLIEKLGSPSPFMSAEQMAMRIQFETVFHKLRPDYYRFIYNVETNEKGRITGHTVYRINSNLGSEIDRVKSSWISAMREKNFISTDSAGNKYINITKLADIDVSEGTYKNNIKWLKDLGWDFDANLNTTEDITHFNREVNALRAAFMRTESTSPAEFMSALTTGKIIKDDATSTAIRDNGYVYIKDHRSDQYGKYKEEVILDKNRFSTRLNNIIDFYVKAKGDFSDTQHFNIEGDPQQNTIMDNFISRQAKDINGNETLNELFNAMPGLKNNAFSKGSQLLKLGGVNSLYDKQGNRKRTINVGIAEGVKSESSDSKGTHETKLKLITRKLIEFNHNMNGTYMVLVPANIKTPYTFDFGLFFNGEDTGQNLDKKVWDMWSEYLIDEMNVIQDYNNKDIGKNIAVFNEKYNPESNLTKAQHLQMFKDILPEKLVGKITSFANKSASREESRQFLEGIKEDFMEGFYDHVNKIADDTIRDFQRNHVLEMNSVGRWSFFGADRDKTLDALGKLTFDESSLRDAFRIRTLNYMTANLEQYKLFFSDPIFWKDITKRIRSFVSGYEHTVNGTDASNEYNVWAKNNRNNVSNLAETARLQGLVRTNGKINLESRGFLPYNGTFNKITLRDVNVISHFYMDLVNSGASKEDLALYDPYKTLNEADSQGGVTLPAYRESLDRAGKWNPYNEVLYQYEMAYERQKLSEKDGDHYAYTDPQLEKLDKELLAGGDPMDKWDLDEQDMARFNILKPLKAGYAVNPDMLHPSLDKYSLSPMFYRLLEESENGLSMYNQMMDQNVHYFITEGGNKVGALTTEAGKTSLHEVYGEDGKTVVQDFTKEENDWKYFGIQVEVPNKPYAKRGSQITKQALSDMFENSVYNAPLDSNVSDKEWRTMSDDDRLKTSAFYRSYRENKDLLNTWTAIGRRRLFKELGIAKNPINGRLEYSDMRLVEGFLRDNMKGIRTENLKDAIRLDIDPDGIGVPKFRLPLDVTPVSDKVQSILFSYIDDEVVRPTIKGGAKPQVASTFFEKGNRKYVFLNKEGKYEDVTDPSQLSASERSKMQLTSNDLEFYKNKDGKITGMEVYLPWHYAGQIDMGKVDKSLLSGIGFRIPTQSLASVEHIIIKGFLPRAMGDCIVVPSEIVGKAGSDFDIDKLNLYLFEHHYKNGRYEKLPYLTDKNSTPERRYINHIMESTERSETKFVDETPSEEFAKFKNDFQEELAGIRSRILAQKDKDISDAKDIYAGEKEALGGIRDAEKKAYVNGLFNTGLALFRGLDISVKEPLWDNHAMNTTLGLKGAAGIATHRGLALELLQSAATDPADKQTLTDMVKIYDQQIMALTGKSRMDAFFALGKDKAWGDLQSRKALIKDLAKQELFNDLSKTKKANAEKAFNFIFEHAKEIANRNGHTSYSEFKDWTIMSQNTEKALKNRYIENLQEILSNPDVFRNLMTPNTNATLKGLSEKVEANEKGITVEKLKAEKKKEVNNHSRMLDPNYIAKTRDAFNTGTEGVGITAVNATNHIINTIAGTWLKTNKYIRFDHNTVVKIVRLGENGGTIEKEFPSLGFTKDRAGNWISQNISEFLNAYVDVAKDPFIISMNAGTANASTFLFMNKIGIPLEDATWFLNQPIIKEFNVFDDMVRSYHADLNPAFHEKEVEDRAGELHTVNIGKYTWRDDSLKKLFRSTTIDPNKAKIAKYDIKQMKEDAATWIRAKAAGKTDELPQNFFERQWTVYKDYRDFKDSLAQAMTSLLANTKYDTAQFDGLSRVRVMAERFKWLKASSDSWHADKGSTAIGNLDEYMASLHMQGIKDVYPEFTEAFGNLFFTEKPEVRRVVDQAFKQFMATGKVDDAAELGDFMNKEFATYVLNTTPITIDGKTRALSDHLGAMMIGDGSMSNRLSKLIARIKNGSLTASQALDELQPYNTSNNENDPKNIRMWSSKYTAPEQNQIYYEFLDMNTSGDPELKKFKDNLVPFLMLQSGLNNSPLNFSRFMPIEDYGRIAQPVFAAFDHLSESQLLPFIDQVISNNVRTMADNLDDKRDLRDASELLGFAEGLETSPYLESAFVLKTMDDPRKENWRKPVYIMRDTKDGYTRDDINEMVANDDFSFVRTRIFVQVNDELGNPIPYVDDLGQKSYIYRQVPVLGDGYKMKEYYATDPTRPSILEKNREYTSPDQDGNRQVKKFISLPEMREYLAERAAKSRTANAEYTNSSNDTEMPTQTIPVPQLDPPKPETKGTIKLNIIEDWVQQGKATTTIRNAGYHKEFYRGDGIYKTEKGNLVDIAYKGKVKLEGDNVVGKDITYTKDEFGKAEGFTDWAGFVKDSKYAGKTLQEGKEVHLYDISPVKADEPLPVPQPKSLPSIDSSRKINIYAGSGENAHLSNFANRKFTIGGSEYSSVEQYFQLQKFEIAGVMEFDYDAKNAQQIADKIHEVADKISKTTDGAKLKKLGNTKIAGVTFNEKMWDRFGKEAMKEAIKASFEQNPAALKSLLDTGNAELTHTQDKTKWGEEFPKLLMETRDELAAEKAKEDLTKNSPEGLPPIKRTPKDCA